MEYVFVILVLGTAISGSMAIFYHKKLSNCSCGGRIKKIGEVYMFNKCHKVYKVRSK